ncbi:MAG TPA: prepilin-type N-terminal cleavage/methylation domain-containing protein [Gammaproteobacteria bacterium]
MNWRAAVRGFTLLELLLVILITGILAAVVAPVIRQPVQAYFDQAGRAELVYSAEMALRNIARDARRSLPYSVRINAAQTAVEFVRITDAARYNTTGNNAERLRFNNPDGSFSLVGRFSNITTSPYVLSGDERLVVFNLGAAGQDIYQGDPVATPDAATMTITISDNGNEHGITLVPDHQFDQASPSNRVYLANGAISYACFNGGLFRQSGYGYVSTQPAPSVVAAGILMTDNVTDCQFDYDPGNAGRPGLLVMKLTLTRNGESIALLREVHIPNAT